jgi:small subunit ribosomal protein S24e
MTSRLFPFHMRRLALLLQSRQLPVMQLDPSQRASSSRAIIAGVKRSFSQQASALSDSSSTSKAPRIDHPHLSPRRKPSPPPASMSSPRKSSPPASMPSPPRRKPSPSASVSSSSRGKTQRSRNGGFFGFGVKHHSASNAEPSSSKFQKKRAQRRLPRLEGPLHTEEYIVQQYKKSPLPLKPLHESTPKSSIGNFSMVVAGTTPKYTFVEGYISADSGPLDIWR